MNDNFDGFGHITGGFLIADSDSLMLTRNFVCPLLVGRARQLEEVQMLLGQAVAGQGQLALLSSEAGIGKSRLIHEIMLLAREAGFTSLLGECLEYQQIVPFSALIDLLRRFMDEKPGLTEPGKFEGWLSNFTTLLPELSDWRGRESGFPIDDPVQEKQRLFYALAEFLSAQMSSGPLLCIIEDIHWSDAVSLEFLLYWLRRIHNQNVLVLLTYRDDERNDTLIQFLDTLERTVHPHSIHLNALSSEQVELMLRAIFAQQRPVSAEFVQLINELTEGNPFFIEEVLKSLWTAGVISEKGGNWERQPLGALRIPRNIQSSILLRLKRIAPHSQETLNLAAVAGRRFDYRLLVELSGRDENAIIADLRELVGAQLLVEVQAGIFSFRHALTRQAVYYSLLELERRQLHQQIADALERYYAGKLDDYAAEFATTTMSPVIGKKSWSILKYPATVPCD